MWTLTFWWGILHPPETVLPYPSSIFSIYCKGSYYWRGKRIIHNESYFICKKSVAAYLSRSIEADDWHQTQPWPTTPNLAIKPWPLQGSLTDGNQQCIDPGGVSFLNFENIGGISFFDNLRLEFVNVQAWRTKYSSEELHVKRGQKLSKIKCQ